MCYEEQTLHFCLEKKICLAVRYEYQLATPDYTFLTT